MNLNIKKNQQFHFSNVIVFYQQTAAVFMQYIKVIFFLNFFVFGACNKESAIKDYINIEQDIEVSLNQNVSESGPYTELVMATVDSVNCKNIQLAVESTIKDAKIDIYINGLSNVEICNPGKTKPTAFSNIGNPLTDQNITFILKESIISNGKLSLNGSKMELNLESAKGLILKNNRIMKLGLNTVWGFIVTTDASALSDFQALINKNKQATFLPEHGNYGLFQYFNENDIRLTDPKIGNADFENKKFYFQFQNWSNFVDDVNAYKSSHPKVIISARNFKDKSL